MKNDLILLMTKYIMLKRLKMTMSVREIVVLIPKIPKAARELLVLDRYM